jgi:hypothetical protein
MSCEPAPGFAQPRVLQEGGRHSRAGGNRLLLYEIEGRPALLKVYRRRGGVWRERLKRFSYRFLEGKRGVTARERCEVERTNLKLWREQGFDVPALLQHALPPEVEDGVGLWMEYCPGPLLVRVLEDPQQPLAERIRSVERFASGLARRQRRARDLDERRLVMKHASTKHVLVHGDRQVNFDLETRYTSDFPILDGLADELAGYLRSVLRSPADPDALGAAFVRGYSDPAFLGALASHGLRSGGLRQRLKRANDARRRRGLSEAGALRWLSEQGGVALSPSQRTGS